MREEPRVLLLLFSLLVSCLLPAQSQPRRAPSTPEERQRFVALTRKLEQNPLGKDLYEEKKWARQWLEEIPDINVTVCAPVSFGQDFLKEHYEYTPQLSYQATFGAAAYMIEHPDKKDDTPSQHFAGVESALKAYSALVKSDANSRSRSLEALLEKQSQGTLAEFVHEASKGCDVKE
jgi:hypothetical protein